MSKTIAFLLLLGLAAPAKAQPASGADPVRPITLQEAFAHALEQSETLAMQGETVVSLDARINEISAALLPSVALNGLQSWQNASGGTASKSQGALAVHQSLFEGMRNILAVKGARQQSEAARRAYDRAAQLLYLNVAQAYLNLVYIRNEIAIHERQAGITEARIKELLDREQIGRSRHSEVLAAQSQLALFQAQRASSVGEERSYQWMLRFLTGIDEDLNPQAIPLPKIPRLADYLATIMKRPDVEQKRHELEYAQIFSKIQSRQAWPSAAFDGDLYFIRPNDSSRKDWDAALSISLPLYTGGAIKAQVTQARSARRIAELQLELALRRAETDVRAAYDALVNALLQEAALDNAVAAAKANSLAQEADYRLGLVTNLDVLSGESSVQDARLLLEKSKVSAVLARIALEIAAGSLQTR